MSLQFYPLTVNYWQKETDDSVVIGFDTSEYPETLFKFIAGQNINIRFFKNGEDIRRTYSICTAPSENLLRIGVRAIPDGIFSDLALNHLKIGDTLDVMPAAGHFTIQKRHGTGAYVFLAIGSGITPILSMIKHILSENPESQCVLIYGNRKITTMMFREDLNALKNKYMNRLQIINVFTQEVMDSDLLSGRLNQNKCKNLIEALIPDKLESDYFICGPEQFTLETKQLLTEQMHIPENQVHFELFHTGQIQTTSPTIVTAGPESAKVTIRLDGKETQFDLSAKGMNILDAGIQNGLDLPYACKGGVCSTCKARLESGEVHMDINYSLEPEETSAGYILTCQSHPVTDQVLVNFDY